MNDNDTDTLEDSENSETSTETEIIAEIKKSHRMRIVEALDATCPKLRGILKEEVDPIKDKYKHLWHLKNHLKVKTLWEAVENAPLPAFKAEEFALMITAPEEKDIRTLQIQVKQYLSTKDRESNILGAFEKSKLDEAIAYVKKWPNAFRVKSKTVTPEVTPQVTPEVTVAVQAPIAEPIPRTVVNPADNSQTYTYGKTHGRKPLWVMEMEKGITPNVVPIQKAPVTEAPAVEVAPINKRVINPLNPSQSYLPGQRGKIPFWFRDLIKGESKDTPVQTAPMVPKIETSKSEVIVNPFDKTQTYVVGSRGRPAAWYTLMMNIKNRTGTIHNPADPKDKFIYGQRGRKKLWVLELEAKIE